MTVYLDLVMGMNFGVDFLLLLGTNRLTGFPPGTRRCALAAALGAIYAMLSLLPRFSFLGSGFWRLVFLGLMGLTAFGMNAGAWRRTGIFLLLSMAMGGIALGMERRGAAMLLLAAAGVWVLSRIGFGTTAGGRDFLPLTIHHGAGSATAIALLDTGNALRDPITGEQILVMGPGAAEKLLGLTRDQLAAPLDTLASNPGQGLRLVPYQALGAGGLLLAKRFEDVMLGGQKRPSLVAFAPDRIGRGDVYQALAGGMR